MRNSGLPVAYNTILREQRDYFRQAKLSGLIRWTSASAISQQLTCSNEIVFTNSGLNREGARLEV
jgi:hypothetical protein